MSNGLDYVQSAVIPLRQVDGLCGSGIIFPPAQSLKVVTLGFGESGEPGQGIRSTRDD